MVLSHKLNGAQRHSPSLIQAQGHRGPVSGSTGAKGEENNTKTLLQSLRAVGLSRVTAHEERGKQTPQRCVGADSTFAGFPTVGTAQTRPC